MALRFDGRVVLITGAGNGIGREYALEFARRGAKVVVNDLGVDTTGTGTSRSAADTVVELIRALGAEAVASYDSVEQGDRIVQTALEAFGRVDILINNAGVLRDSSFNKMTTEHWDPVLNINLRGPFLLSRAVWGTMRNQKYGRIIFTSSGSGLYGNFGQANYSAAKMGLNGLTSTLAKEGAKYNIHVNSIAPMAFTRLTVGVIVESMEPFFTPAKIVPAVVWLCHESCRETGSILELAAGLYTKVRLQRSSGLLLEGDHTAEDVKAGWDRVSDYSEADYPTMNNDIIVKRFSMGSNKTSLEVDADTLFRAMKGYIDTGRLKQEFAKVRAVYHFEILKAEGPQVYTVDMNSSLVAKGALGKPDVTYTLSEPDFLAMATGRLNSRQAIIEKRLKIKGSFAKATKFFPKLFPPVSGELLSQYAVAKL
jgi:3-hydroxyacyl-CoA dehydrogenase/3a,7a,12a-trihydroxy-5b-cholest-24-enoyl-CoA hydratase